MIKLATKEDENKIAELLCIDENCNNDNKMNNMLENDVFLMQIKAMFLSYKTSHPNCRFYFVSPNNNCNENIGILCVQASSATYAGPLQDSEEMEMFLKSLNIEYFKSNNMVLFNFEKIPKYIMCLKAGTYADVYSAQVDDNPDLWELAHSDMLKGVDPEAFYSDAVIRTKCGLADIRAISIKNENGKKEYITAVVTKKEHRKKGYACTLLSTFARVYGNKDLYVVCDKELEHFYEQLGFVFYKPACVCKKV